MIQPRQSYWFLGALLSLAGCFPAQSPQANQPESNQRMANLLRDIDAHRSFRTDGFYTEAYAAYLIGIQMDPLTKPALERDSKLASQWLASGQTQQAIDLMLQMQHTLAANPQLNDAKFSRELKSQLALAYLRKGELDNCLANHNQDTCLFPIKDGGVHIHQQGSRAAMALYLELLQADPNDLTAQWLLNLSAMTLGSYPDGVPEAFRLNPTLFASDVPMQRFLDVAPATNSAIQGLAGGVITEDFNGDGLVDILCSSWGLTDQMRYLENNGKGGFTDRTEAAGLLGLTAGLNMIQADYDNDGFVDVLVLRGAWRNKGGLIPNSLLRNRGGHFEDVTQAAGLLSFSPTQTGAWADFDRDGHIDLFIGNESVQDNRHPCKLYRNQGDGTFRDVAPGSGLDVIGYVKGATWGDIDNDGDPDLYLSLLNTYNLLFRNDGLAPDGRPIFTDISASAGVTEPKHSFPTWFFDFDNDGWLDLFVSGYGSDYQATVADNVLADLLGQETTAQYPRLYRNLGNATFEDVTVSVGLHRVCLTMGCGFGDLDNDGWLDMYLGTGAPDFRALVPNLMFRNDRGVQFQDVTASGGFGHLQKGHGIAFADLDNDGDQDIYAVMGGAYKGDTFANVLFENPGNPNHWLTLVFQGTSSSRDARGTRYQLEVTGKQMSRNIFGLVSSNSSFGGATLNQETGLGQDVETVSLIVDWPVSGRQHYQVRRVNAAYRVVEGQPELESLALPRLQLGNISQHDGAHHH